MSYFTGIAVFNGKHSHIIFSVDYRLIGSFKISTGNPLTFREDPSRSNMCKRTLYTAVGYFQPILHPVLISPGNGHHVL